MTLYLPRAAWTARKPRSVTPLRNPKGVAVHWPGSSSTFAGKSQATIARYLAGIQAGHMDDRGWNDIAYQAAIDHDDRVWELRGEAVQSGANGDSEANRDYGAVLFLVGIGEKPSAGMYDAFRDWRRTRWLTRFPKATQVRTHNDVRPEATECPGPYLTAVVRDGTLLEDDMATPDEIWWETTVKRYIDGEVVRVPVIQEVADAKTIAMTILQALTGFDEAFVDEASLARQLAPLLITPLREAVLAAVPEASTESVEEALRSVFGSLDEAQATPSNAGG